jgi:hypothetical protein
MMCIRIGLFWGFSIGAFAGPEERDRCLESSWAALDRIRALFTLHRLRKKQ